MTFTWLQWYVHTKWWGRSGPYRFSVACIAARNVWLNTGTKPRISTSSEPKDVWR